MRMVINKDIAKMLAKWDLYFNANPFRKFMRVLIFLFFLSPLVIFPLIIHQKNMDKIFKYGKFTIGVTGNPFLTLRSGFHMEYDFYINKKMYYGDAIYERDYDVAPGGRYFVKYDSIDPAVSKILLKSQVPDSIISAPPNGWNKIP